MKKTTNRRMNIAVDLDGTLAEYDEFKDRLHIGRPIARMVAKVKEAIRNGHSVWIFTSRLAPIESWMDEARLPVSEQERTQAEVCRTIQAWCTENIGVALPVTGLKLRIFHEFWDDRAFGVAKNGGEFTSNNWPASLTFKFEEHPRKEQSAPFVPVPQTVIKTKPAKFGGGKLQ